MEEQTDIISDIGIEHYDELDYEIKLEFNDEEEPITILITSSNNVGVQICEICSKSLKSMKYLEEHMKTHSNPNFHCSDCGKTLDTKKKLSDHRRSHKTKQCSKCDKSISKINIAKHEQACQGPVEMLRIKFYELLNNTLP